MDEIYLKLNEEYTFNIFNSYFSENLPYIASGESLVEIISGVETSWVTNYGKVIEGNIGDVADYDLSSEPIKVYSSINPLTDPVELQKVQIKFTPGILGEYYLQDKRDTNIKIRLIVIEDYGQELNPEEIYQTLFLQRSNRLYTIPFNEDTVLKFIDNFIPASLKVRRDNLPPTLSGWLNEGLDEDGFYSPTDTAILCGVMEDPEDDVLTYNWEHVGIRYDYENGEYTTTPVVATDLKCTISPNDSAQISLEITDPPVETLYTFKLICADTDNTVILLDAVPVYSALGYLKFAIWGQDDFYLGNADLPFSYYPD